MQLDDSNINDTTNYIKTELYHNYDLSRKKRIDSKHYKELNPKEAYKYGELARRIFTPIYKVNKQTGIKEEYKRKACLDIYYNPTWHQGHYYYYKHDFFLQEERYRNIRRNMPPYKWEFFRRNNKLTIALNFNNMGLLVEKDSQNPWSKFIYLKARQFQFKDPFIILKEYLNPKIDPFLDDTELHHFSRVEAVKAFQKLIERRRIYSLFWYLLDWNVVHRGRRGHDFPYRDDTNISYNSEQPINYHALPCNGNETFSRFLQRLNHIEMFNTKYFFNFMNQYISHFQ